MTAGRVAGRSEITILLDKCLMTIWDASAINEGKKKENVPSGTLK
jgi:hypothetical protein